MADTQTEDEKKKKNTDWMAEIMARSQPINTHSGDNSDWMTQIMQNSAPANSSAVNPLNIDDSREAPAKIRLEVGALEKPEDRLKAIRKSYPDAQPYGDGNFIYTDPKTGRTTMFNQEGWMPSLGDFAEYSPSIAETGGSILGGFLGGLGGGAVGSAVPVLGTGTGAVTGAIAGAGTGGTVGREAAQRGLNYLFGNEDTRTGGEQIKDAALTFGLNAAGEGVGRGVAKVGGAVLDKVRGTAVKNIINGVDDAGKVAERMADYEAAGISPTIGMVSGNPRTAALEHGLAYQLGGDSIQKVQTAAKEGAENLVAKTIDNISPNRPTISESGTLIQDTIKGAKDASIQRQNQLYTEAEKAITAPAHVGNTTDLLARLQADKASLSEFEKITKTAAIDDALKPITAIVKDGNNGIDFTKLKEARTYFGKLAADTEDPFQKKIYNQAYESLTADMQQTAANSGEDALRQFNKANNKSRRFYEEFGKGTVNDKALKADTDKVHSLVFGQVKNGGNQVAAIRRTMLKQEGGQQAWDDIVSGNLERMGTNSKGEFSPDIFVSNLNRISPEAKTALFRNPQHLKDVENAVKVLDHNRKYFAQGNKSNTASIMTAMENLNPFDPKRIMGQFAGIAGVLSGNPAAMAASGLPMVKSAVSYMSNSKRAAMLSNPQGAGWLANVAKAGVQKGGGEAHLSKLAKITKTSSDRAFVEAARTLMDELGYNYNEND